MIDFLRLAGSLAALCASLFATPGAIAEAYPSRPVTLIVPFPAGGPSDALARAVAQKMAVPLGQPIVIENLGGANGAIGLTKATKAAPDGYTISFGGIGTHVANVALYKKLAYDPVADFAPIGPAGAAPMLLLARADLPAKDLREFAAWLSTNKGKASYGSAGVGSISHYGCVLLLSSMGQNVTHVPYKGVAPAVNDLMGGQTDFMCDQSTTALPQVAGGRIKAIAVLSSMRLTQLPRVSTATESGHPLDVRSWNAFFAPRGTPQPVLAKLTSALQQAVADPALRKQMEGLGVVLPAPADATPAAVAALIERGIRDDVPALKAKGEYLD
ncbi:Argininosuccinate lyase [Variovorax sp. PBS-H4]|uniref:tripartite tricarboxylate transporter substrate-binding protein n=1 Tax=Variovorax sp. PBS-H4 TaxID=434008 RepID=UPI0013166A39|nr:tripartite tricarboxylate transporter substrate-binding protein [Variovorax sp. PBS-H4]VTU40225.1 Argininosuccinate lyase [Variovorax sp. PBS-H4]